MGPGVLLVPIPTREKEPGVRGRVAPGVVGQIQLFVKGRFNIFYARLNIFSISYLLSFTFTGRP